MSDCILKKVDLVLNHPKSTLDFMASIAIAVFGPFCTCQPQGLKLYNDLIPKDLTDEPRELIDGLDDNIN